MAEGNPSDRILPHSQDAERSLLGAILADNRHLHSAAEVLVLDDFHSNRHRKIFECMLRLSDQKRGIDLVTLKDDLQRLDVLESVGGFVYLASLVDGIPKTVHARHYATLIKEKAILRNLIQAAHDIETDCYRQVGEAPAVLDQAQQRIFNIADTGASRLRGGFQPVGEISKEMYRELEAMTGRQDLITGVPSGYPELDQLLCGFQRSDLVVVAARPSMGKTSLCLNVAQYAASHGSTVGIFSVEMAKKQLVLRLMCSEAEVSSQKVRSGFASREDWLKLSMALARLGDAKIFIDDTPGLGLLELKSKARRLKHEHGLDMIIVDYLQLMRGVGENRQQEISAISRALKEVAKELDVPVLVGSQLSRAPEARQDHRPVLSDLRESGAIEQDADVVLFIYRKDTYQQDADPEEKGVAEIIIGKQRNGPTGTVKLLFQSDFTRFVNLEVTHWSH